MPVSEQDLCVWTQAFCASLDENGGRRSLLDHISHSSDQQPSLELRAVLRQVHDMVAEGYGLSHALSQHPSVFPEAYLVTVRYGEIYGEVDVALRRYVEHPEDRAARCRLPEQPAV